MKIFTENGVYVQKNDIAYLYHTDIPIPVVVFNKIYSDGIFIVDSRNRNEFILFNEKDAIDFFSKINWILDYNIYKDLTIEELFKKYKKLCNQSVAVGIKYDSFSSSEKKQHIDLLELYDRLEYQTNAIRDLILLKQGKINYELPEGIEVVKQEKGIRKILIRIKRKNNKKA